jgi:SAM-dependent methyltransferase
MSFTYQELEKRQVSCPVCGNQTFCRLATEDRYDMGLTTVGCTGCGLIMTNPMPTPSALVEFYRHHYRPLYRKVSVPTPEYVQKLGLDQRARYTAAFLSGAGLLSPSARVLDVGCAEGSLLAEIRRRCPEAALVGIELGEGFAQYCRETLGLRVFDSLGALASAHATRFDLIVAIHVLEHVGDPVGFLQGLRPWLKVGSTVLVDVPDAGAYTSLDDLHLAHLYHFSIHTLALTAQRAGLFPMVLERHDPPYHPRSIRALLRLADPGIRLETVDDHDTVFARLRSVGRKTSYYRLRRSLAGRALGAGWRPLRHLLDVWHRRPRRDAER